MPISMTVPPSQGFLACVRRCCKLSYDLVRLTSRSLAREIAGSGPRQSCGSPAPGSSARPVGQHAWLSRDSQGAGCLLQKQSLMRYFAVPAFLTESEVSTVPR